MQHVMNGACTPVYVDRSLTSEDVEEVAKDDRYRCRNGEVNEFIESITLTNLDSETGHKGD